MRRHAVVVLSLAALAALAVLGLASAQREAPDRVVTITTSTVDVRVTPDMRSDVQFLWNRDIRHRPIGHAIISCIALGSGGILGRGVYSCQATYVLPLGKITAAGVIHSFQRFTLVLTGGTGRYAGASGSLFSRHQGAGDHRLVINL